MQRFLWPIATLLAVTSCGDDGPVSAPFGLDKRPANPTCIAKQRPVLNTGVKLQQQWTGVTFNQPLYLTQAPGDSTQWYEVERQGKVRVFPTGATGNTQIRDFASVTVDATGEGGLLGLAFHPGWPNKREVYLSYTRTPGAGDPMPVCPAQMRSELISIVSRFQSSNGTSLDSPADEILKVGQPFTNHKGGNIQFGFDGMLYLGLGDGGSGDDPCGSGQNTASLLGKLLRLDVNAPAGMYKIPTDNPFAGSATARQEIWAYGLRNPWRWSFDKASGELWVGDVGQNTWEEVDRVVKGGNYGWNTCEGFHQRGSTANLCNTPGLIDPIVEHPRSEAQSITGGYVYRGTAMPSLIGTYIYGDYITGNIWALTYDVNNKPTPKLIAKVTASTLVSFGQGNDGEIYTVQMDPATGAGTLSKLMPSGPQPTDNFPQLLSQTGCVDPRDPAQPAEGLIPYDVNSPLWSDGADKQRYLAIPDGATIAINADQDWDLPIGSVAMKTFSVGGKRVETRLFMRHDDGGWAGYTYEWNDDGKDATLLSGSKLKTLGAAASWAYPSRLETAQLNRDGVYPSTNRRSNQLATLDHIGLFSAPLAGKPADLPRLPEPGGNDPLETRARSYLHGNCSHCHRPMGGGQGTMDLRYAQSLKDTVTCNADNTQGTVDGATKLIAPGAPDMSIMSQRLHATDSKRMPPVAVSVTDPLGTKLIDDWISSLTTCP
ncbi:MAG: hypothetical protein E6J90_45450 [Deltaproteobacteria bacterium]|nr:MAG: hypothetical protein E6J90_45450 [Deltaproteobacteria bacterium]